MLAATCAFITPLVTPPRPPAQHPRAAPALLSATTTVSPWLVPLQNVAALTGAAHTPADVVIRSATPQDALALSKLCTDCFFGTHTATDGPIIFLQRSLIWSRVFRQVLRRLAIEEDGRECRLVVAADKTTGTVEACVDVAIHLFDRDLQRFELMIDEMPVGSEARRRYGWRPYVASLAVTNTERRRGLGRMLMREAERTARKWGYRELMLEVAKGNDPALSFYRRTGYKVVREQPADATGGGSATVVRVVRGLYWEIDTVAKVLMRKMIL